MRPHGVPLGLWLQQAVLYQYSWYTDNWQSQENVMDQGPWRKMELTHTHSYSLIHQHKDTLVHPLMCLDLRCFMSAPGTLSVVISLVLSVSWIKQVCLHTATCLRTPLMRLLTLGFRLCWFVYVFWCDTLLMLRMREDRCLCVFLCGCGSDWKNETVDLFEMQCLFMPINSANSRKLHNSDRSKW